MTPDERGPIKAALIRYLFFAESVEGPAGTREFLEKSDFLSAMWGAVSGWSAGHGVKLTPPFPPPFPNQETRTDRAEIYPTGTTTVWLDTQDVKVQASVRAKWLQETLCLELGLRALSAADKTTWLNLKQRMGELADVIRNARCFLGTLDAYAGQVDNETAARAAASAALEADGPEPFPPRQVALPGGGWLFDAAGLPDTVAVFSTQQLGDESRVDHFLGGALLEISLYAAKIVHQYRRYWDTARDGLDKSELRLAGILHASDPPADPKLTQAEKIHQSLERLQSRVEKVAGAYGEFAARLSIFQRLQHSVSINVTNLESCLSAYNLPIEGPLGALRNDVATKTGQLRVDGGFYEVRVREAEMTMRSLQGQAEILRARLAEQSNERLDRNIQHIKSVQTFLHYIEYFLVSVYFAHLADMVLIHAPEVAQLDEEGSAGWSINWVVLVGALLGLVVAFVLDPEKQHILDKLSGRSHKPK